MLADDRRVDLASARSLLVYRDATLPTRFYYASTRPAVARGPDGYQLALVHYDKPVDGRAGMLSFVVDLRPLDEEMDAMRRELSALAGAEPVCVPLPWTAGAVAIAVAGGEPVTGKPSLLGDNTAAVSIPLTLDQYLMLRQRKNGPAAAAWAVYDLAFDALRPAYAASIRVDETRLRDWLQKKCSVDFGLVSFEKVDTFEELRASGVIRVEFDSMTGEQAPDGFRLSFLRSLQSVLAPLPRFAAAPEAGGGNWLVGIDCSTVHDTQQIVRRLDTDMRLTDAVARKAWIQGELAGFDAALAARPDIELATGAGFNQTLTVRCHDAFAAQPLSAATVQLEQEGEPAGFHHFTRADDAWTVDLTNPPGAQGGHTCRLTCYFGDRGLAPCSGEIPVGPTQAFLDIVPATFFSYRRYTVGVADDFPWDLVDVVRVALRGPATLAFQPGQAVLVSGAPSAVIEAFAPAPLDLDEIGYGATFVAARTRAEFPLAGSPAGAAIFLNPFTRRVVTFRAPEDFDWQDGARIEIVVQARDGSPQLWSRPGITLSATARQGKFTYWYAQDRTIRYRARISGTAQAATISPTDTDQLDIVLAAPAPTAPTTPQGDIHDLHR